MPPSSAVPRAFKVSDVETVHGQYAGFISRAVALIIDCLLVAIFVVITDWLAVQVLSMVGIRIETCTAYVPVTDFRTFVKDICRTIRIGIYAFSVLAFPIYFYTLWWLGGQTIGMGITGVRVIRVNGERLRPHNAIRRVLGYALCILSLGIGFLWCLIDSRRQGLHDRIARTVVVYWRPDERRILLARLRAAAPGSPARRSGLPAMDAPAPENIAKPSPAEAATARANGAFGAAASGPDVSVSPEAAENTQFEI